MFNRMMWDGRPDGAGLFFGMLVCVLLVVLFVWLLLHLSSGHNGSHDEASALLRARFARGEITKEEFEVATKALRDNDRK